MYPVIRLAHAMLTVKADPSFELGETAERSMLCRPWDCDVFFELNNGRQLTLYDLGRFDYGLRIGLMKILRDNKWGLVVAGSTIRYRKRIMPLQRFSMKTRLIGREERWFYFEQGMWRGEECCSSALVRTAVTASGKVVPSADVAAAMGRPDWNPAIPDWAKHWIEADSLRPWPPAL